MPPHTGQHVSDKNDDGNAGDISDNGEVSDLSNGASAHGAVGSSKIVPSNERVPI